jgi:hypothetical protein
MATTTNYGWTTPDDTALVKDGASAIRTLGSSVDTTTKALNPETTLGDISYRSSTANVKTRLGLGTAGQVLTVNSGATAPEWKVVAAAPASASSYISGNNSTNSATFTGLSTAQAVTLTTGTKVMIIITAKCETNSGTGNIAYMGYAISGATTVAASDGKAAAWANRVASTSNVYDTRTSVFFETVTAGSNTFTAQVRTTAGSSYFQERQLLVIDLGS